MDFQQILTIIELAGKYLPGILQAIYDEVEQLRQKGAITPEQFAELQTKMQAQHEALQAMASK